MRKLIVFLVLAALVMPPIQSNAHPHEPIMVESLDGSISFELSVGDEIGGSTIAVADLGDDGVPEIVIGSGMGSEPRVRVLRQDGSEIGSFLAYASTLGVGINVVTCDLTGDGYNEIVTAPQRGGGPHIRVFDRYGTPIDAGGFFAYDGLFRGGVNLACGDLHNDARAELVTLPAASGGPHVRVWSIGHEHYELDSDFFAFDDSSRLGVVGAVHDKKLFLAEQFTSTPTLKTIVIHSDPSVEKTQNFSHDGLGINNIFVHNDDVYAASATTGTVFNTSDETTHDIETVFGGVSATSDGNHIYHTSGRRSFDENTNGNRIVVDVSDQRLYAFESGALRNSFLISSGLNNATPLGNHEVLAKIPEVHYAWFYGSGSPYNYDLGWIPYNLRFYPHIYIHYAPWHNNFGHQMSHGCVNVALEDMMWVYEWAEVGIDVVVQE